MMISILISKRYLFKMMGFVLAADKLAEKFVNGKEGEVYLVKNISWKG